MYCILCILSVHDICFIFVLIFSVTNRPLLIANMRLLVLADHSIADSVIWNMFAMLLYIICRVSFMYILRMWITACDAQLFPSIAVFTSCAISWLYCSLICTSCYDICHLLVTAPFALIKLAVFWNYNCFKHHWSLLTSGLWLYLCVCMYVYYTLDAGWMWMAACNSVFCNLHLVWEDILTLNVCMF